MISRTHLYEEIKQAEDIIGKDKASVEELLKTLIKIATITTKLLHNIRSNQSAIMTNMGVKKLKPQRPDGERGEGRIADDRDREEKDKE